ncbi:hypothetical protein CALVIDRAFT_567906 [Calocera viscosa TUFC12733]|nr:hypothetical protein CALVIDRAFT_567906 [Calocera viscosa TUFC12733]
MNLLTLVLVLWRLRQFLGNISVQQVVAFLAFSRRLQSRIAWQQITRIDELDTPPKTLPNTVIIFLANAIDASPTQVTGLWNALREVVWLPGFNPSAVAVPLVDDFAPFARLAQSFSLGIEELYPPTRVCTRNGCPEFLNNNRRQPLHDARRYCAGLYTLGRGAFPVIVVSLRCRSCRATYCLNYYRE